MATVRGRPNRFPARPTCNRLVVQSRAGGGPRHPSCTVHRAPGTSPWSTSIRSGPTRIPRDERARDAMWTSGRARQCIRRHRMELRPASSRNVCCCRRACPVRPVRRVHAGRAVGVERDASERCAAGVRRRPVRGNIHARSSVGRIRGGEPVLLQSSALVHRGNSGGMLLDVDAGRAIGTTPSRNRGLNAADKHMV